MGSVKLTSAMAMLAGLCVISPAQAEKVAGYAIFRHDEEQKCSASRFFETDKGREANITYFAFDDGRKDELFFGLRPNMALGRREPSIQTVEFLVDGAPGLGGMVIVDMTGMFRLPPRTAAQNTQFWTLLDAGQELVLDDVEQRLSIDLEDLRLARSALAKCVEKTNASS